MKTYYSDYVEHAMKDFTKLLVNDRELTHFFESEADEKNWYACRSALSTFGAVQIAMLLNVFAGDDTLSDNVYYCAKDYNVDQNVIWALVTDLTVKVAKRRGLI